MTNDIEKRKWNNPAEVATLALRVASASGRFTTTLAFMTNHATERAEEIERKCPKITRKHAELKRPLVISFSDSEWFISDTAQGAAVWINDKLHNYLCLCYQTSPNGDNWIVKTIPTTKMWERAFKLAPTQGELLELPLLLLQSNTDEDEAPVEPKPQEIMKPTASFEFQKKCLSQMPTENLKRFRKKLGISGNPNGKPGRASLEALRQQVYDFLEARNRWIEISTFR